MNDRFRPVPQRARLLAALATAALGAGLSACVPVALVGGAVGAGTLLMSAERRSSETQSADRNIESAAQESVVKLLPGRGHVNVTSYYRKVLLTGEVPSAQDRQAVEAQVRATPGVQSIVNDLAVMADSSALQRSNDAYTTSKVRARMVGTNGVPSANIKVLTERGTTYIMGRLTAQEAQLATDLVAQTDGVQRVVRLIDVIADPMGGSAGAGSSASAAAGVPTDPAVISPAGAGESVPGVVTQPVTQPTVEQVRPPVQVQSLPPLK